MRKPVVRTAALVGVVLVGAVLVAGPPVAAAPPAAGQSGTARTGSAASLRAVADRPGTAAPGTSAGAYRTVPRRHLLGVEGIGPYRIGTSTLAGLTARGLVTDVEPETTCEGFFFARATGRYADRLRLVFQGERLVLVSTEDPTIRATGGGVIGLTLDELETRYGTRGHIENGKWWLRAYIVPVGDRVIAFFEDPYGPTVWRLASGERARVLASFTGGDDQC